MLTADTITDEQIRELQQSVAGYAFPASGMSHTVHAETWDACHDALAAIPNATHPDAELLLGIRERARARCAEILNARAAKSADHATQVETEARGERTGNSELHLYHRWTCSCGASGAWGHALWASTSIAAAKHGARRHVESAARASEEG